MDSPTRNNRTNSRSHPGHFIVDFVIWFGSILISAIPSFLHQIHPIEALIDIPYFLRLITDVGVTYSFITGIAVLTIQLLLIEGRNEFIKKKARKPVLGVLAFFDFVIISFYSHLSTMEYSDIENLFRSDLVKGGIREANVVIIITIIIVSLVLMIFHSLPKKVKKTSFGKTVYRMINSR